MRSPKPLEHDAATAALLAWYGGGGWEAWVAFRQEAEGLLAGFFGAYRAFAVRGLVAQTVEDVRKCPETSRFDPAKGTLVNWLYAFARTRLDVRLLELAREGRNDALDELYKLHRPRLVRMLAGSVRRDDLDDLVDEVLIRALYPRASARFNPSEGTFKSWLETIALNALRDHKRRKDVRARREVVGLPPLEEPPASAESEVEREAQHRGVIRSLKRKRTLLLNVLGFSAEKIASLDGTTTQAVYNKTNRERDSLRQEHYDIECGEEKSCPKD